MKIAYISNTRFPSERAHAVQIVQMCNAFVQQGHEVSLLVTNRATHIAQTPEDFYGTPLLFSLERIPVPDIAGNILKLSKFLWPYVYTVQKIIFALHVWRYVTKNKFECIYGRDEWILMLLSYVTKIPVVWESHEAKYLFAARRLLHYSKNVVVISEGIRDFYIQKGIPTSKMLVAHDAIDGSFFEPTISKKDAREQLGIVSDVPVVMYIGGLDEWKGVHTLFEAVEGHTQEFGVYLIGGREEELKVYREKYPHVHFLGPRPYKQLRDFQQAADILVIPNTAKNKLSAEYTSPLKLFAYMTSKIPIVASNIASITNVLSNEHAFFFEADNPSSLSAVIEEVIQNPETASEKALQAYELSKEYTWNTRAEHIIQFIS